MNKFNSWLKTANGKRFTYEVKSFLMTFASVFSLLIAPQLVLAAESASYNVEFLNTLLGGVAVALARSFFITIIKLLGFDYRVDTSKYPK